MIPKTCPFKDKEKLWTTLHGKCFGYTQEAFFDIDNYDRCAICSHFEGIPIPHVSSMPHTMKFIYDDREMVLKESHEE